MISELRTQLATDLEAANLTVHDDWPEDFSPPAVMIVTPRGGTYITRGQLVGEFELNLDLICVVKQSANALSDLDTLIETVLMNTVDWAFRGVDTPTFTSIYGADYPATVIHIAKQYRLYTP